MIGNSELAVVRLSLSVDLKQSSDVSLAQHYVGVRGETWEA